MYSEWGRYVIIGRAKRAPHKGVQSRFRVIYIYMCDGMSVVCQINCIGGITRTKHAHAQIKFWAVNFDYTLEHLYYGTFT